MATPQEIIQAGRLTPAVIPEQGLQDFAYGIVNNFGQRCAHHGLLYEHPYEDAFYCAGCNCFWIWNGEYYAITPVSIKGQLNRHRQMAERRQAVDEAQFDIADRMFPGPNPFEYW